MNSRAEPPPVTESAAPVGATVAIDLLVDVLAGAETDLDRAGFYSRLAEVTCRIGGMRRALIVRYDDATRRVEAAGGHGIDVGHFAGVPLNLELAPHAARALAEDRVVEVRPPEPHDIPAEFAGLIGDHPLVYVPIAAAGRWPGVIIAEPHDGSGPLSSERRELLWMLGKTLALVSVARTATFQGERARELEERIDLARDVHEQVVQRLFGVSMALSPPGPLPDEARERCAGEVQGALGDLRHALQRPLGRPSRVTTTTLAEELRQLSSGRGGARVRVQGDVPVLPADFEPLAQSVLAEALRNVRKHAPAQVAIVRVRREPGVLLLEVENEAAAKRAPGPPGMGLRLAALEALHAGGVLEFGERAPGRWQVRLVVPEPAR